MNSEAQVHAKTDTRYPLFALQIRRGDALRSIARLMFRVTTVFGLGLFVSIGAPDVGPHGAEVLEDCVQAVALIGYVSAILLSVAAEYFESRAAEELLELCRRDSTRHPRRHATLPPSVAAAAEGRGALHA
jgi:hypothetical protein